MKLPFRRDVGRPAHPPTPAPVRRRSRRRVSRTMAIAGLSVLALGLGGLGWGLVWLMSDLPRHDRQWAPHEALAGPTQFLRDEDRKFASMDRQTLAAIDSTAQLAEPPPIGEGPSVPEETQPQGDTILPDVDLTKQEDSPRAPAAAPAEAPAAEESRPASPLTARAPAATAATAKKRSPDATPAQTPPAANGFDAVEKDANEFIRSYLSTAERQIPSREAAYYADHVNYFKHGRVSRSFVERDQRNYYRRWPKRDYTLLSAPEVVEIGPSDVLVQFRINYAVSNGTRIARGVTRNRVRLKQTDSTFRITSIQEYHER